MRKKRPAYVQGYVQGITIEEFSVNSCCDETLQ